MAIYQGNKKIATSVQMNYSTTPVGTILSFAGSKVPNGFLICDGSEVSKTTYADLYKVVGDLYGESGSEETFLLPNAKGRVLQGADGNLGTYIAESLPNITGKFYHDTNVTNNTLEGAFSYTGGSSLNLANSTTATSGYVEFDASKSNPIYSGEHVQQNGIAVTYIIKALKVSDKYAEEVGALIDDSATDDTNKTWSAKKISSQISNGAIPQAEFNTNADINLNDYRNTGYWYFPDDLAWDEYKYTILNAPEDQFIPPGGFGLDVRHYGSQYCTQILYAYNSIPETYQRCYFFTNNALQWSAWRKVAFSA